MAVVNDENIIAFLLERLAGPAKTLLLKTDRKGEIVHVSGNKADFAGLPETGRMVGDIFPFLGTFYPAGLPMKPADIPHLVWENRYLNVSVFRDENFATWFLITDATDEVARMKPYIQKNNVFALEHKRQNTFDNPFGNLHLFSVACFIAAGDGKFLPQGKLPDWVAPYFPVIGQSGDGPAELTEIFPYLDVFMPEAENFWKAEKENLLGSDMWIESPAPGVELHFRAFATSKNGNHYLLIRRLEDDDIPISQRTIQKAREHQLLYEKLQKAEKELKQLLYYKDKFVSIVSHDLRSPMASVVSAAEMLLTDERLMSVISDFNREVLQSMKEELERLLEYNNRLYHWSNLELGNFKLDKEKISVKKLIDRAVQTAKNKMEAKNIRYEAVVPEDFDSEVDVSLFSQALNNLLGNAVKFTPENGEIKAGAIREKDTIRFFVSDTGVGMSEAIQKSVFAGVPNESTLGTSGEKGSGLGLDIVRKIVEAHGFTIGVQSQPGKGTVFTITVPKEST